MSAEICRHKECSRKETAEMKKVRRGKPEDVVKATQEEDVARVKRSGGGGWQKWCCRGEAKEGAADSRSDSTPAVGCCRSGGEEDGQK